MFVIHSCEIYLTLRNRDVVIAVILQLVHRNFFDLKTSNSIIYSISSCFEQRQHDVQTNVLGVKADIVPFATYISNGVLI